MEERMKNRLKLLGILFITGLVIAGLFIIFVVPVRTVVTISQGVNVSIDGDKGLIYKDGKVLHTFTLPPSYFEGDEDYEYSWNSPNISEGGIRLGKKVIKNIEISDARVNELIEIAKKDNRVLEFIVGKEYRVTAATIDPMRDRNDSRTDGEDKEGYIVFEVEGKFYQVRMNLPGKKVWQVKEQPSKSVIFHYYRGRVE